jgi:lysophospholipase
MNTKLNWSDVKSEFQISHLDSSQIGQTLYLKKWSNVTVERNKLVFVLFHDLCQYSDAFKNFINWSLENNNNIEIYSFDFIGHGQSSGTRGHFEDFEYLVEDSLIVLSQLNLTSEDNVFLFGHGLGGIVLIDMFNRYSKKLNFRPLGLVLTNFLLSFESFIFKNLNQKMLNNVLVKRLKLKNIYRPKDITNHTNAAYTFAEDPLIIHRPTLGSVMEIKEKVKGIYQDSYFLDLPIFLGWSDIDPYLNKSGMAYFIKGIKKEYLFEKRYSLMKHDLYNEIDSEIFYQDIKKWIQANEKSN